MPKKTSWSHENLDLSELGQLLHEHRPFDKQIDTHNKHKRLKSVRESLTGKNACLKEIKDQTFIVGLKRLINTIKAKLSGDIKQRKATGGGTYQVMATEDEERFYSLVARDFQTAIPGIPDSMGHYSGGTLGELERSETASAEAVGLKTLGLKLKNRTVLSGPKRLANTVAPLNSKRQQDLTNVSHETFSENEETYENPAETPKDPCNDNEKESDASTDSDDDDTESDTDSDTDETSTSDDSEDKADDNDDNNEAVKAQSSQRRRWSDDAAELFRVPDDAVMADEGHDLPDPEESFNRTKSGFHNQLARNNRGGTSDAKKASAKVILARNAFEKSNLSEVYNSRKLAASREADFQMNRINALKRENQRKKKLDKTQAKRGKRLFRLEKNHQKKMFQLEYNKSYGEALVERIHKLDELNQMENQAEYPQERTRLIQEAKHFYLTQCPPPDKRRKLKD